jgi:predicted transcriptional regulator of viral defense system
MKRDYLLELMRAKNTVFTASDIALLWGESDVDFVRKKIYRYIKAGKLYPLRRGIYAKDKKYDKYELATKILTPAYVSFETVLAQAGVIFQFYDQIFVASYLTREVVIDGQTYTFKKIKDAILTNRAGIEEKANYFIATPERALLDVLYLNKDYHFDNLGNIDWPKVTAILPIYGGNKRMERLVKKFLKATQEGLN